MTQLLLKSGLAETPFTPCTKAFVINYLYHKFAYGDFLENIHPDVLNFVKETLANKESSKSDIEAISYTLSRIVKNTP
jgi:hypothetical protein